MGSDRVNLTMPSDRSDTSTLFSQLKEVVSYIERELQEKQEELQVQAEELEVQNEELRNSNDALRKAEAVNSFLASIVESSGDAIVGNTLDGFITSWNAGAERMFGYSAAEMLGKHISILTPPGHKSEVPGIVEKIKNGERVEHFDTVRVKKDGTLINISLCLSPIIDKSGAIVGASSIKRDITQRKMAEEALQEKQEEIEVQAEELEAQNEELHINNAELEKQIEERLKVENDLQKSRFILTKSQEMARMGNWAWNVPTGEITMSDEGYRIFGLPAGETHTHEDAIVARAHDDDRPALIDFIDTVKRDGTRKSIDYRTTMPDGGVRYVMLLADKIVRDQAGKTKRVYGIAQDITERKKSEEALASEKAQAELYLDIMGHDISNMHQIAMAHLEMAREALGAGRTLGSGDLELVNTPLSTLERSASLIDNVRKLQKIRSGRCKTDVIDLGSMLSEIVNDTKNIPDMDVTINYAPAHDHFVRANPLLRDVFVNLVGNAIKHSNGPATIDILVENVDDDGERFYHVAIEDDGPGIPDEKKSEIFHRFRQGHTTAKGVGLGLYIVKTLVESFHGIVRAEDRVRGDHTQGARFVVMLPAVVARSP